MATLGGDLFTLADTAKLLDPKGMLARVINTLSQSNPMIEDAFVMPSNLPTSHRGSRVVGEPTVGFRRINAGVASSKATFEQYEDVISLIETQSTVDEELLNISGNPSAIRAKFAKPFVSAMTKFVTESLIYGSLADNDAEFNGLNVRYGTLGDNVLGCGDTGSDLSSIYLINWCEDFHLIYPMNTQGGLVHVDRGPQQVQQSTDPAGAKYWAYVDQFKWHIGLSVGDNRQAVRICNLQVADVEGISGLQEMTDYTTNILFRMYDAIAALPDEGGGGKPCFYMPRSVYRGLNKQALARQVGAINLGADTSHTGAGKGGTDGTKFKPVMTVGGIPVKIVDQMGYAESTVSS